MAHPINTCLRCHRDRPMWGRGMCRSCYVYSSFKGQLGDWPLQILRSADFADDYRILRDRGLALEQVAAQMGRQVETVCSAVLHAVRLGNLPKRFAPEARRHFDTGWADRPLCTRERRLLTYYATSERPQPAADLGLTPNTVRAYKYRIRRKLHVESWDDAVKAYVAEAVSS